MIQTHQQPDIIGAFFQELAAVLGDGAVPPDVRRTVEAKLRFDFGGQEVYIKTKSSDAEARAVAIRAKYNRCNRRELQLEFGIGRAQFYKIIKGG